jgi:hypothetical protein
VCALPHVSPIWLPFVTPATAWFVQDASPTWLFRSLAFLTNGIFSSTRFHLPLAQLPLAVEGSLPATVEQHLREM